MSSSRLPRLAASLAVVVLAAPGAVVLVRSTLGPDGPGARTVDGVVATAVLLAGAVVLGWYALTAALAAVCLGARLLGRGWRCGEDVVRSAGAPLLRRLVTVGAGAAVAAGMVISPVAAEPLPRDAVSVAFEIPEEVAVPDDLGWGASDHPTTADDTLTDDGPPASDDPGRPSEPPADAPSSTEPVPRAPSQEPTDQAPADTAPSPGSPTAQGPGPESSDPRSPGSSGTPSPGAPSPGPGSPAAETPVEAPAPPGENPADGTASPEGADGTAGDHVVRAGESLWSIAAAELGADATPAQIAARWPQWFEANSDLIGADPDLIHPGQELHAPADNPEEDA